ncbi:tRNA uridine-5-carboxymethylaminomethyl(34) synthesis GTPase MnmE [Rhodobacteraceae bacterium NNCM2]|nr:tRNA uridine-5-carboxymethylaminomethyl(34) synthesis GTPase MnmE [Coraliihabitans acroporae]
MAETIVALSSGAGRSAVAVIRVSGPSALTMLEGLAGELPPPRLISLRKLRDQVGAILDEAIVFWFPKGRSYTGEAMVEIQCHGGVAVVHAILDAILALPDCRLAEAGEFTLRAFKDGRMDLAEVEALGDLIDAETEAQRLQSVRMIEGALHHRAQVWRAKLIRAIALVEITIDWADEEVPEDVDPEVSAIVTDLIAEMKRELKGSIAAERLRLGFEVAILGAPNAGKSSFINYLAGKDAAITSPIPGTTRDVIELRYDLDGLPVRFLDMAGLRESDDPIEQEGVKRAVERARGADLRLAMMCGDAPFPTEFESLCVEGDLRVWSKSDIAAASDGFDHVISTRQATGVDGLLKAISEKLQHQMTGIGVLGHRRQQEAIEDVLKALEVVQDRLQTAASELVAEDLRIASRALGRLTGGVDVEEILGEVFSRFCVGK